MAIHWKWNTVYLTENDTFYFWFILNDTINFSCMFLSIGQVTFLCIHKNCIYWGYNNKLNRAPHTNIIHNTGLYERVVGFLLSTLVSRPNLTCNRFLQNQINFEQSETDIWYSMCNDNIRKIFIISWF